MTHLLRISKYVALALSILLPCSAKSTTGNGPLVLSGSNSHSALVDGGHIEAMRDLFQLPGVRDTMTDVLLSEPLAYKQSSIKAAVVSVGSAKPCGTWCHWALFLTVSTSTDTFAAYLNAGESRARVSRRFNARSIRALFADHERVYFWVELGSNWEGYQERQVADSSATTTVRAGRDGAKSQTETNAWEQIDWLGYLFSFHPYQGLHSLAMDIPVFRKTRGHSWNGPPLPDSMEGQITVKVPSPQRIAVSRRTPQLFDEQKAWLGTHLLPVEENR